VVQARDDHGGSQVVVKGGIDDEGFLLTLVTLRLVQVCPAVVPQFFTNWALQAQYATYAHAFLLGYFVTIENKRLVNPTPKRKVACWNRAGDTNFPKELGSRLYRTNR
jgi:hypothetical protein